MHVVRVLRARVVGIWRVVVVRRIVRRRRAREDMI